MVPCLPAPGRAGADKEVAGADELVRGEDLMGVGEREKREKRQRENQVESRDATREETRRRATTLSGARSKKLTPRSAKPLSLSTGMSLSAAPLNVECRAKRMVRVCVSAMGEVSMDD